MSSARKSSPPQEGALNRPTLTRLLESAGKLVGRTPLAAGRLAANKVLYVDWTAQSYEKFESHGVVHNNFGGYAMSRPEAEALARLDERIQARQAELGPRDYDTPDDPHLRALYDERNQHYDVGYPEFSLTRIARANQTEPIAPHRGDILDNLAEPEGITRFIGCNDHAGIKARLAQLGMRDTAPNMPEPSRPAASTVTPPLVALSAAAPYEFPDIPMPSASSYEHPVVEEDGDAPLFSEQPDSSYRHHTQYSGVDKVLEEIDGTLKAVYYVDNEPFFAPDTI